MSFYRNRPFNDLPFLPPPVELETRPVLNLSIQSTDRKDMSISGGRFRHIDKIPKITLASYIHLKTEDLAEFLK